jgi:hypothetical protein
MTNNIFNYKCNYCLNCIQPNNSTLTNNHRFCIGDHPQEELAKLGYRLERKVKTIKNPAIEPIF